MQIQILSIAFNDFIAPIANLGVSIVNFFGNSQMAANGAAYGIALALLALGALGLFILNRIFKFY